ncbi:MAG TPA: FAD-dependent thymidylate synthase [Limnochordia bacterium]
MEVQLEVRLLQHTPEPLRQLYVEFRTCYSRKTPLEIWDEVGSGRITREQMLTFIRERLATGHTSPYTQVYWTWGVAFLSRAASHQQVRHHIGIDYEQQSQRYCVFKAGEFPFVVPPSWKRASAGLLEKYLALMRQIGELYAEAVEAGIPAEDARFVLPNAAATNLTMTANYLEMLHICDLRLCWRAQWEIRRLWAAIRGQMMRHCEDCRLLAAYMQPKCGEHRMGYCDESREDWAACPIGKVRPHRSQVSAWLGREDGANSRNSHPAAPISEELFGKLAACDTGEER